MAVLVTVAVGWVASTVPWFTARSVPSSQTWACGERKHTLPSNPQLEVHSLNSSFCLSLSLPLSLSLSLSLSLPPSLSLSVSYTCLEWYWNAFKSIQYNFSWKSTIQVHRHVYAYVWYLPNSGSGVEVGDTATAKVKQQNNIPWCNENILKLAQNYLYTMYYYCDSLGRGEVNTQLCSPCRLDNNERTCMHADII